MTRPPHLDAIVRRSMTRSRAALIGARTADGRFRAKARGVRFGGKLKLSKFQISEALPGKRANGCGTLPGLME